MSYVTALPTARQEVESLLPMLRRLARGCERKWSMPAGIEHDDLVDEGVVALLQATRRFDPTRGCSFRTFGSYAAKGAMLDQLRKRFTTLNREAPALAEPQMAYDPEPDRVTLQHEALAALSTHLNSDERSLVVGWVGGDTLKTLGKQFGMSITTAHKHFHGAMHKVQVALHVKEALAIGNASQSSCGLRPYLYTGSVDFAGAAMDFEVHLKNMSIPFGYRYPVTIVISSTKIITS